MPRRLRAIVRRAAGIAGVAVLAVATLGAAHTPQPPLLDRVLAVVSGAVLTLSDARLVLDMGFVEVPRGRDPVAVALAWLIERELVLNESARYEAGDEDLVGVEAALTIVRRRFPTDAAWVAAKRRHAQTDDSLRVFIADTLSAQAFVERRFAAQPPPSEADLTAYFERHRKEFAVGGDTPTIETARERVERTVRDERRTRAVADWLARLRRRADVSELYTASR
jgi:hypothetical protein